MCEGFSKHLLRHKYFINVLHIQKKIVKFFQCPEDVWDKIFEVNVKSAFMLSKEVVPHLKKRGKGSIIYISSIAAYQPLDVSYAILI